MLILMFCRFREECTKVNCDYYLSVDSGAQLTNPDALRLLIEQNR